jgi:hypothetical protein
MGQLDSTCSAPPWRAPGPSSPAARWPAVRRRVAVQAAFAANFVIVKTRKSLHRLKGWEPGASKLWVYSIRLVQPPTVAREDEALQALLQLRLLGVAVYKLHF